MRTTGTGQFCNGLHTCKGYLEPIHQGALSRNSQKGNDDDVDRKELPVVRGVAVRIYQLDKSAGGKSDNRDKWICPPSWVLLARSPVHSHSGHDSRYCSHGDSAEEGRSESRSCHLVNHLKPKDTGSEKAMGAIRT